MINLEGIELYGDVNLCYEGESFTSLHDFWDAGKEVPWSCKQFIESSKVADPANSPILFRYDECGEGPFTPGDLLKNSFIHKMVQFLLKNIHVSLRDWIWLAEN